ncbi:MAG: AAC(3) family N-acetyltransferase [Clostridia bacterium]|nr:AAC(3) family N-acetyltransferase [Clostridia bacterium]
MKETPIVSKDMLMEGFRSLGLGKTDTVLVHSAMSSFGYVEGGAETVIGALLDTACEGTVLVPTLTGSPEDGPEKPPFCDVRSTPCWTGRIPETFRKDPRAVRSLHPTHSVAAIGANQNELTAGHEKSLTPCDEHSPYYKLGQMGGYILLIGVGQNNNTTIHSIEEIAKVPYHLHSYETEGIVVDKDGNTLTVKNYLHSWDPPHANFDLLEPLLMEGGAVRIGKIGASTVRLVSAEKLFKIGVETLRKDPYFMIPKV